MSAVVSIAKRQRLADFAARCKVAIKAGDTAPSLLAAEVVSISRQWDQYRAEAEDRSFATWLREDVSTKTLAWWIGLADAVDTLTRPVALRMHHEAVRRFRTRTLVSF